MKKPIVIVIIAAIVVAGLGIGGTWYFMDQQNRNQRMEADKIAEDLQAQIDKLKDSDQEDESDKEEDETANWKAYDDTRYSIKYPESWTYKNDYWLGQDFSMVAIGKSASDLPAPQSDQISAIAINGGIGDSLTSSFKASNTVQISSVTIGNGIKATKIVLLPGRENDMNGNSKITYYEIKAKDSSYIRISNFEDYQISTFNQMLSTFRLK